MRGSLFALAAMLMACTSDHDAPILPLCADLGCTDYATCGSLRGDNCHCHGTACTILPRCDLIGCDQDHPPSCPETISCVCSIDGHDSRCFPAGDP